MCALVPPLFPHFDWPCGDQSFYYVNDDLTNTFLDFRCRTWRWLIRMCRRRDMES
ncbi:BnaC04g01770D [Brassica napus]|uniref:Uncharacterized protein n=2 Tax=Brassica TaxID=3705 RepID=A0A3P6BRI5_BRAOL|nr:unnamed protein product [Brassica napus]CDY23860.1 BnaC04g01770D [Brassica napus]VDD04220.1 unnamed protein product [Brassica oleracea]